MKYKVQGFVTIVLELKEEFEDDGKLDLMDQARDALGNSDEIPLSLLHDVSEIEIERVMEVRDEA